MLQLMRKHAKYFYVLFVVVILSFIFWGVGGVDQNTTLPLAEIGDETISVQEYWRAYERSVDRYRSVYGPTFDPEAMDLKAKVLDDIVNERLLLVAAAEAGMRVGDEELERSIINDPVFLRDGVFNKDVYVRTLELSRMTPTFYEAQKRRELLVIKMSRLITEAVELTPAETESISMGNPNADSMRETMLARKKDETIKSYLNSVIKRVPVTINRQLIL